MNIIFVHIGTNDYTNYSGSGSLQNVMRHLRYNIKLIKKLNPSAKIYGILPISRYDANGMNRNNMADMYGYTFHDLRAAEAKLYKSMGATVINFQQFAPNVITDTNKDVTLKITKFTPLPRQLRNWGMRWRRKLLSKKYDNTTQRMLIWSDLAR